MFREADAYLQKKFCWYLSVVLPEIAENQISKFFFFFQSDGLNFDLVQVLGRKLHQMKDYKLPDRIKNCRSHVL